MTYVRINQEPVKPLEFICNCIVSILAIDCILGGAKIYLKENNFFFSIVILSITCIVTHIVIWFKLERNNLISLEKFDSYFKPLFLVGVPGIIVSFFTPGLMGDIAKNISFAICWSALMMLVYPMRKERWNKI